MRATVLWRVLAVGLVAAGLAPAARADGGHLPAPSAEGRYTSSLVDVPSGVTATLLTGRLPGIALRTSRVVVVFGERGEEMARVRDGVIEVNDDSPTWRVTADARSDPPGTGWRALNSPQLTWLEPRARPVTTDHRTRTWRVPLTVDGAPAALVGETRWVAPPSHGDDSPSVAAPWWAAFVALAAGALVLVQRRRSGSPNGLSRRGSSGS